MIDLKTRRAQLTRLIETLDDVLVLLRLDSQCVYLPQFEQFRQTAQQLATVGFTQPELDDFSRSICRLFDSYQEGFRSYRPPTGLPVDGLYGTGNFETFVSVLYARALELRTIDSL